MKIAFASILGDDSEFEIDDQGYVTWEGVPIGWLKDAVAAVYVEADGVTPWEHALHRALLMRQVQAALRPPQEPEPEPEPEAPAVHPLEARLQGMEARLAKLES